MDTGGDHRARARSYGYRWDHKARKELWIQVGIIGLGQGVMDTGGIIRLGQGLGN